MIPQVHMLLVYACAALVGLGLTGSLVLRSLNQKQKLDARALAVLGPHLPDIGPAKPATVRIANVTEALSLRDRLAKLFGIVPERVDEYPLRWWIVLAITFGLARVGASLASNMLGSSAMLLMIPAWIMLSRAFFKRHEYKRTEKLFKQFPDALGIIVRSVRVGIPVTEAIRIVSRESVEPTASEFLILSDQISIGVAMEEALKRMGTRNNIADYRFFATALSLQAQTGGGLAETLEGLADVIRKRVAGKARARALASEANTSAIILACIPAVASGALALLNPSYIGELVTSPSGQKLLALAIFLVTMGVGVMKTIIRKSLS